MINPVSMSILCGILGNGATALIRSSFTSIFGEKPDALSQKVFDAAERAAKIFFKKYRNHFGKESDSFLARPDNWAAIFNLIRFDTPSVSVDTINPKGFYDAEPATEEAIKFFLSTLMDEFNKDIELSNLLAQKEHISIGNETNEIVKRFDSKLDTLTTKHNLTTLPKSLTNKIPRTSRDKIVGRESDLEKLHKNLFDNKQVVLVNGMGGIGKTTLAQVYVNEYWDEYKHVAWISQLSGDVKSDFLNTEGLLHNLSINSEGKTPDVLFQEVISELNKIETSPNLLVIDNADGSLRDFHDYLPGQPAWHVLVTSRERIENFDLQKIGFLTEDEAVELFLKHYTIGKISREEILILVNTVELHTLTIEILAKSAQLQRVEFNKLKTAITNDLRVNVLVTHHEGDKIERITSYLCSIFRMSKLSNNETWLLKQFTCLPAEFHEYKLLKLLINPKACEKEDVFSETLECLSSRGWLLKSSDGESFRMHHIIAEVFCRQYTITLEEVEPLIDAVTEQLNFDRTKDNPVDKFPWVPFGESILTVFIERDHYSIIILQNNLAIFLQLLGDYTGAKTLFEKAIKSSEKNFGPEDPITVRISSNFALVLQDLGDYLGAKTLLEKAMESNEKNFGIGHPTTAVSYSNLAMVLQNFGDYAGAKEFLEKAMMSTKKNFGMDHPNTADINSNLAVLLQAIGDYTGAKLLLVKAMEFAQRKFGPEHPFTAKCYSNLAAVLKDLGDYENALKLSDKSVAIFKKVLPKNHTYIKIAIDNYQFIKSCSYRTN